MSAYATGFIAGVELIKDGNVCKVQIIDGSNFFSAFVGSVRTASDGTPYVQLLNPGTKGVRFGVLMDFMPMTVFSAIRTAIDAALGAQEAFPIVLQDDVHDINVSAVPDYTGGQWLSYPTQRLNASYIAGVTMRFVCSA